MEDYLYITIIKEGEKKYYIYTSKKDDILHFFIKKNDILVEVDEETNLALNKKYFDKDAILYSAYSRLKNIAVVALAFGITLTNLSSSFLERDIDYSIIKEPPAKELVQPYKGMEAPSIEKILGIDIFSQTKEEKEDQKTEEKQSLEERLEVEEETILDLVTDKVETVTATIKEEQPLMEEQGRINYYIEKYNLTYISPIIRHLPDLFLEIMDGYTEEEKNKFLENGPTLEGTLPLDEQLALRLYNSMSDSEKIDYLTGGDEESKKLLDRYPKTLANISQAKLIFIICSSQRSESLIQQIKNYRISLGLEETIKLIIETQGLEDIRELILQNQETVFQYCAINNIDIDTRNSIDSSDLKVFINESIDRFNYDNIPIYIEKYKLQELESVIMSQQDIFLQLVDAVEKNPTLNDEVKREVLLKIDQINDYIYINSYNITKFIKTLPYLKFSYVESLDGNAAGIFHHIFSQLYGFIPTISISVDNSNVRNHELDHFMSSRKEDSHYQDICYNTLTQQFTATFDENTYYVSFNGSGFEEGLTELISTEYAKSHPKSYYFSHTICMSLSRILGAERLVEAYYSEDKIIFILNKLLEYGYSAEEIIAIFTRFDLELRSDFNGKKLNLLSYQIIEDLLKMYEKVNKKSFEGDLPFILAINKLKVGLNFEEINEAIQNGELTYNEDIIYNFNMLESLLGESINMEGYKLQPSINLPSLYYINMKENSDIIYFALFYQGIDNWQDWLEITYEYNIETGEIKLVPVSVDLKPKEIYDMTSEIQVNSMEGVAEVSRTISK